MQLTKILKTSRGFLVALLFLISVLRPIEAQNWMQRQNDSVRGFLHIYDAGAAQSLATIQTAFTNAAIDQVIVNVRTNLDYLSTLELALDIREAKLVRDASIFAILTIKTNFVEFLGDQLIASDFQMISGGVTNDFYAQLENENRKLRLDANAFQQNSGKSPPSFSLTGDYPETINDFTNGLNKRAISRLQINYESILSNYAKISNCYAGIFSITNGLLSDALSQWTNELVNLRDQQIAADALAKKLATNTAAYNNAVSNKCSIFVLSSNLENIASIIAEATQQTNLLATKAGVEQQLQAVNLIISAASTGSISNVVKITNNPALSAAVQVAGQLPGLFQSVSNLATFANATPISGLLLNKQLLQIQLNTLNQKIALDQSDVDNAAKAVNALLEQIHLLNVAKRYLVSLKSKNSTASELLTSTNLFDRQAVVSAIIAYGDSIQFAGEAYYQSQSVMVQIKYEKAAIASQQSLQQWEMLVQMPITQLINFFNTGIKSDQLAQTVVDALGLAAIAWRL